MSIGFTQRDVDPLGRGDTAQPEAGVAGAGMVCVCDHPLGGVAYCPIHNACDENTLRLRDAQASDLHKCDENTLRSENR